MTDFILNERVVVISDLHVADPVDHRLDDFDHDDRLEHLLMSVVPNDLGEKVTLVINGDFIDFAQVLPELGRHGFGTRLGALEDESNWKLDRVVRGHPTVFASIGRFIGAGNHVVIVPGNHDVDFYWPSVFDRFRDSLGVPPGPHIAFAKDGVIHERRIHIEHGHQYSFDNRFKHWPSPIVESATGRRLERPWGTFFLDSVYNELEDCYPFLNQVMPHSVMATIALKSLLRRNGASPVLVSKLLAFFVAQGKRLSVEHLLGQEAAAANLPSDVRTAIDTIIAEVGVTISPQMATQLAADVEQILVSCDPASPRTQQSESATRPRLLGRNDATGMRKRESILLKYGDVDIVAFGHTHRPVDGNVHPRFGEDCPLRSFNTGTWMPTIRVEGAPNVSMEDLETLPRTRDVRYLAIELGSPAVGHLLCL